MLFLEPFIPPGEFPPPPVPPIKECEMDYGVEGSYRIEFL